MASRYFFVLCTLAVIAAVAAAPVEEEVQLEGKDKQRFLGFLTFAAGEAAKYFIKVKPDCFLDIAKNCSAINPVFSPKKYYNCGDKYAKANADRCLKKD